MPLELGRLQAFPKPTAAMISGFCLGNGYHCAGVKRLADLIGPAQAKRLLYTGERFSAEEMLRIGLVDELLAADELAGRVRSLARGHSPQARSTRGHSRGRLAAHARSATPVPSPTQR